MSNNKSVKTLKYLEESKSREQLMLDKLALQEKLLSSLDTIQRLENEVAILSKNKQTVSTQADVDSFKNKTERLIIRFNPKKKYIRFYLKDKNGKANITKLSASDDNLESLINYVYKNVSGKRFPLDKKVQLERTRSTLSDLSEGQLNIDLNSNEEYEMDLHLSN
jgi:uncharacterized protein (UPF0335 family)